MIRFLIRVDCAVASITVFGVFEVQDPAVSDGEFGGERVFNRISSFEITASRLRGLSPAPLKPPRIFFSVILA